MQRIPQSVKIGENCNVKRRPWIRNRNQLRTQHTQFEEKFPRKTRCKCYHGFRKEQNISKGAAMKTIPRLPRGSAGHGARRAAAALARVV